MSRAGVHSECHVRQEVADRRQEDVVVGSGSAADAGERFAFEIFVLRADPQATEIALVEIVPKADRELRDAPVVGNAVGGRDAGKRGGRYDRATNVAEIFAPLFGNASDPGFRPATTRSGGRR